MFAKKSSLVHIFSVRYILILSSHLRPGLLSGFFSWRFAAIMLHACVFDASPLHWMCAQIYAQRDDRACIMSGVEILTKLILILCLGFWSNAGKSWGFVYMTQVTTLSDLAYNISERALDFRDGDEQKALEIKRRWIESIRDKTEMNRKH
jgi:hypothetical protein